MKNIQECAKHYKTLLNKEYIFTKDKSKIIIDFDRNLVSGTELINTKYILYRNLSDSYINLTMGESSDKIYPETFFVENSKKYISEQVLLEIENIDVIERTKKKKTL